MRIDALDVYYVENPLIRPWKTAYGEDPEIFSVLVKMASGNDVGWSESSPLYAPTYSPEFAYGVYLVVTKFLAPLVLGKEFESAEALNDAMAVVKGNPFAHAAVEMAWWTLESKRTGKPLHALLGGTYHEIEAGADFGVQDCVDTLLGLIDGAVQNGYPRIKLKAMPGWDIDMLRVVRGAFPKTTFHIDCNSGYTLADLPLFQQIDKIGLAMIEQPLFHADVLDHATLQRAIDTPICLDESISSPYMAEKALELQACRYINIKPGRCGGLLNAMRINKLCMDAGVGCWIGGMLESAVGAGICIELATMPNMTYPSDLFPSSTYYKKELTVGEITHSSPGHMLPSKTPGNAFVPDPAILKARTLESVHLEK